MDEATEQSSEDAVTTFSPNWRYTSIAIILALLSTLKEISIFGIQFGDNMALAGFAGLIFLWPLIGQMAARGGSTEFFGLKLRIDKLDRRTEEDFGLRMEEVRADLEELRQQVDAMSGQLLSDAEPLAIATTDD